MSYRTIVRGVVTFVDNHHDCPTVQAELLADEVVDNIEHVQPYGLHFHPPTEAECVVACVGDDRANSVAFGLNLRGDRPQEAIEPGEGGLYYQGTYKVFIAADGCVYLGEKSEEADFVALADKVLSELNDIRDKFDKHIHTTTATIGTGGAGTVSAPTASMGSAKSVAAAKVKAV